MPRVLSALMADSCRSSLWPAAYVINGGCSDDGFDFFRGRLMLQGRETFRQAVADPDSLADLAAVRLAVANQAIVECESALNISARSHRAATGDEIPGDAYRMEPLDLLGGGAADHHRRAHCPARRRTCSAQASREGSRTRSA